MNRRTLLKSLAAIAVAPVAALKTAASRRRGKVLQVTISKSFTAVCDVQTMTLSEPLTMACHEDEWVILHGPFNVVGYASRGST